MRDLAFEIDPTWYAQQMTLARSARGGGGISKERDRLLIGFVDSVLILAFPYFEASTLEEGKGEGWFSLNPHRLAKVLATFSSPVRVALGITTLRLGNFQQSHKALKLRPGRNDPELPAVLARIDELIAEQCHWCLLADSAKKERLAENLRWHRAEHATNTTPLVEHIREHSLIVYRRPDAPPNAVASRAIVDKKLIFGRKISLCCHDFLGAEITVDPQWVTHVGC